MTGDYPLLLDLAGRRVVVVGGGTVAARRIAGLLEAGADVHVVAPSGIDVPGVTVHRRSYVDGDLDGAWVVHACTDDPAVNAAVAADAERRRIPCVRADSAGGGTARVPAVARSGEITVAVASGDPARSARIRTEVAALLDTGALPTRRQRREDAGWVALVGGGPGDPGLITVRGRQLLADADVVVVDRLAPRALLDRVDAELVEAGKTPFRPGITQEQINALLVERAGRGQRVVRLKGGDPFVLGRGGEEMAACLAAGVPVRVVPGVSSALAAPAVAGIPLTQRGISADFAVASGYTSVDVAWEALARGPATLVLLMAMDRLDAICAALIRHGRPAATPAAVVQDATLPDQRVVVSTIGALSDDVRAHGLRSPAVVVIGEVVRAVGGPPAAT